MFEQLQKALRSINHNNASGTGFKLLRIVAQEGTQNLPCPLGPASIEVPNRHNVL
jgi:hypothetical protein